VVEDDRTFFCSELVAKAFKVCGVMDNSEEACSNFLPSHFSTNAFNIPLEKGINIESEQLIYKSEE